MVSTQPIIEKEAATAAPVKEWPSWNILWWVHLDLYSDYCPNHGGCSSQEILALNWLKWHLRDLEKLTFFWGWFLCSGQTAWAVPCSAPRARMPRSPWSSKFHLQSSLRGCRLCAAFTCSFNSLRQCWEGSQIKHAHPLGWQLRTRLWQHAQPAAPPATRPQNLRLFRPLLERPQRHQVCVGDGLCVQVTD